MYKCCECGKEFESKPDFCDCGNDIFEEIIDNKQSPPPNMKHKKSFEEQYPGISSFIETLDPISVLIFIFCIILSAVALIFIKPAEQEMADNINQKSIVTRNINTVDINSFWNDTPPKNEKAYINAQNTQAVENKIAVIIPKQEPKVQQTNVKPKVQQTVKPQPKKTTVSPQKPVQTKTTAQKTTQKQQTAVPKSTQQQVKSQTKTVQNSMNPQQANSTQQQTKTQPQQPAQTVSQPVQQAQPVVNPAIIQAQAAQELKTYKNGLRNTLFSKINFTKIYGDGTCVVDFKVNSSGRLVNRSFSKQSTNNTLNDEVYSAVINTPSYKVPPSSYNGQTLHFSVKFTNGHYDVSLY